MRMRLAALALMAVTALASPLRAAEAQLVMFSERGCVYCTLFERDVAPGYKWSLLGKRAPLRKVDLKRNGTGGYPLRSAVTVTPTFVVMKGGREIGRIPGYPGRENFYILVRHMLDKAKSASSERPDSPYIRTVRKR